MWFYKKNFGGFNMKNVKKVKSVKKKEPNKIKNETNNKLVEENAKLNEKLLRVMAEMQNMKRVLKTSVFLSRT